MKFTCGINITRYKVILWREKQRIKTDKKKILKSFQQIFAILFHFGWKTWKSFDWMKLNWKLKLILCLICRISMIVLRQSQPIRTCTNFSVQSNQIRYSPPHEFSDTKLFNFESLFNLTLKPFSASINRHKMKLKFCAIQQQQTEWNE